MEDGATDLTITGNALVGAPGTGTGIATSAGLPALQRVDVTGNAIGNVAGVGLRVLDSLSSTVAGNTVFASATVGLQPWSGSPGAAITGNVVDRSGNAGVQVVNSTDFRVRSNVVRSSGTATTVEQDATGIVVYSRDATVAHGVVAGNRSFDPATNPTQTHGTGTAGTVVDVLFSANVADGNALSSHAAMLVPFPGGATLTPTRAVPSIAVGTTQLAVPHGLGHVPESVVVTARSTGQIWQSAAPDATNVYLTADGPGRLCDLLVG